MIYDAVVIGAGASGMTAAAAAAKAGAKVCVLEAEKRAGKKILVTGNGKCNLTNRRLDAACYRSDSLRPDGHNFIMNVINRFDNKAVIDFFYGEGLLTRERDGYVYPYSEQASSVLDTLRRALTRYGVELVCGCRTERVGKNRKDGKDGKDGVFTVDTTVCDETENGTCFRKKIQGKRLILATGSAAGMPKSGCALGYRVAQEMGHHIIKPLPALVQLTCREKYFKELAGVRAKGTLRLWHSGALLAQEQGEIQFTDVGISGIPVFQVSRYAVRALAKEQKEQGSITADIDFMPEYEEEQLNAYIEKLLSENKNIASSELFTGLVNKKIMGLILKLSGAKPQSMAALLKKFTVTVTGNKGMDMAQVCQGGVRLDEINENTMESRLVQGLYFCGEILDVDGICGGYNLQWAFSSGHLAGESAAERERRTQ